MKGPARRDATTRPRQSLGGRDFGIVYRDRKGQTRQREPPSDKCVHCSAVPRIAPLQSTDRLQTPVPQCIENRDEGIKPKLPHAAVERDAELD